MAEISLTGDQMLKLLEIVAFDGPRTTAQLAETAEINRTVAHRLVNTLHARGYLSRQGKAFTLGPILSQIALSEDLNGIPRIARPVIRDLSDSIGESVVMHRIDGEHAVVVEQAVSEAEVVRVQHREGARHSLCLGASGRAILAWQSDRVIDRLVAQTPDPELTRTRLRETLAQGYARSENELQLGVAGLAVPIVETGGAVRYSVAVLVPTQRAAGLGAALPALLAAQARITALLSAQEAAAD